MTLIERVLHIASCLQSEAKEAQREGCPDCGGGVPPAVIRGYAAGLRDLVQQLLVEKRDRYRETICEGCEHNYYNWPKPKSPNGDVAVADGYFCWHLSSATPEGKCNTARTKEQP